MMGDSPRDSLDSLAPLAPHEALMEPGPALLSLAVRVEVPKVDEKAMQEAGRGVLLRLCCPIGLIGHAVGWGGWESL